MGGPSSTGTSPTRASSGPSTRRASATLSPPARTRPQPRARLSVRARTHRRHPPLRAPRGPSPASRRTERRDRARAPRPSRRDVAASRRAGVRPEPALRRGPATPARPTTQFAVVRTFWSSSASRNPSRKRAVASSSRSSESAASPRFISAVAAPSRSPQAIAQNDALRPPPLGLARTPLQELDAAEHVQHVVLHPRPQRARRRAPALAPGTASRALARAVVLAEVKGGDRCVVDGLRLELGLARAPEERDRALGRCAQGA